MEGRRALTEENSPVFLLFRAAINLGDISYCLVHNLPLKRAPSFPPRNPHNLDKELTCCSMADGSIMSRLYARLVDLEQRRMLRVAMEFDICCEVQTALHAPVTQPRVERRQQQKETPKQLNLTATIILICSFESMANCKG